MSQHVESRVFEALASGRSIGEGDRRHIDRCLACRRTALASGVEPEAFTRQPNRPRTLGVAVALAAALVAMVVLTPLRGAATNFLDIFEAHRVAALPLSLDDMRALGNIPDLSDYATSRPLLASTHAHYSDARAAATAARLALRFPTHFPDTVRAISFDVASPSAQLIAFGATVRPDAARIDATRRIVREPLPPDIASSTLRLDFGSTVIASYDLAASEAERAQLERKILGSHASARPHESGSTYFLVMHGPGAHAISPRATNGNASGKTMSFSGMPLVVAQMPVPRVASTGVSVQRLLAYELGRPGIPPRVRAAFQALGDLSTTLPIPIPIDKAYTQPVFVDGVAGIGLGDNTGIGAIVIWQKSGMLYVVAAAQPAREVLAIANSLR